jgi:hypothetical protein
MEQSPSWDASDTLSYSKNSTLLWNPKVHYRVHKSPPTVPILSQIIPIRIRQPYFFNTFLLSTPRSPEWSLPFRLPNQNLYSFLNYPMRATCLVNLIPLDLIILIIFGEAYKLCSSSLSSFLQLDCHLIPLRSKYSTTHPLLKCPQSVVFP